MTVTVVIDTIEKVKEFTNAALKSKIDNIDVKSGRYVVDARSIMGLFSLDLSNPLDVCFETDNEEELDKFKESISKFIAK